MSRWWKWLSDRRVTCAEGHHIPNTFSIDESGSVRCCKWIDKEKRECGRWIWIFSIRGSGNIVVDVSLEDLKHLKNLTTPTDRITYLQIFEQCHAKAG